MDLFDTRRPFCKFLQFVGRWMGFYNLTQNCVLEQLDPRELVVGVAADGLQQESPRSRDGEHGDGLWDLCRLIGMAFGVSVAGYIQARWLIEYVQCYRAEFIQMVYY